MYHRKNETSFKDFLFLMVSGFAALFVLAFIIINPPTKRADIPAKAEYLFIIEWDDNMADDIDLWVQDPNGITVSFRRKEGGLLNLEKDDLGVTNDSYIDRDGNTQTLRLNREVTTMRGIVPGTYTVMAHIYSKSLLGRYDEELGNWDYQQRQWSPLSFTLLRVNPYKETWRSEHRYSSRRQEIPLLQFDLDEEGNASNFRMPTQSIITRSPVTQTQIEDTFVSGGETTGPKSNQTRESILRSLQNAPPWNGVDP